MDSLEELFDNTLQDIYSAEKQFLKAMTKLADLAVNAKLKATIHDHILQTQNHVRRLEQVADLRGIKPSGKVCKAAQGLVEEANEHLQEFKAGAALDAAIILCAQKNEHYEISTYGTLIEWANLLRLPDVAELLQDSLNEEKAADHLLTSAARPVNADARKQPQEAVSK